MATMQRQNELTASTVSALDDYSEMLLALMSKCEQWETDLETGNMTWERLGTIRYIVSRLRELTESVN
jgi:hypothetical protein